MNAQPAPSAKSNVAIKIIGLCLMVFGLGLAATMLGGRGATASGIFMIIGGCGVCLFVEGVKRQILKAIEDSRKE